VSSWTFAPNQSAMKSSLRTRYAEVLRRCGHAALETPHK
jgi:hypothetical protein